MIRQVSVENADKLMASMAVYWEDLGKVPTDVIRQQSRLLATELMDQTPPFPRDSDGTSLAGREVGMKAVRRDINAAITPYNLVFENSFTNPVMEKTIQRKNYEKLNAMMKNMDKLKKWEAVPFTETLHTGPRDRYKSYGYIRNQKKLTLDMRKHNSYSTKVAERVGMLKAGWAMAIVKLTGRPNLLPENASSQEIKKATGVPMWVSQHIPYCKGFVDDQTDTETPKVRMDNDALVNLKSKLNFAFVKRTMAIQRDIAYKMNWIKQHAFKK